MATRSCCSTPRTAVAGGRSATSAPAPCRSTKRSSASATIHTSWNCARLTIEPRQRIDTQSEDRSLETTVRMSNLAFFTHNEPRLLQGLQALGEQGRRHQRHVPAQVVEAMRPVEEPQLWIDLEHFAVA